MDIEQIINNKIKKSGYKGKTAFAEACGIASGNINKMIATPTLATLERFATALGCEVWQLLQPEQTPAANESKDKITGFLKVNGQIIEVRTFEDLQSIIQQHRTQ
ncbi:MAG: helix-turn-helix domain-containing protein [Prevotella sp.]|nr:helix-turn-helix domain-containing protein [Prevotella sp.]